MECPKCHAECQCDSVHNGVALIYGPYGCPQCGWSENDEYDLSTGKSPVDERGGVIDQYGGYHPPGSLKAVACRGAPTPGPWTVVKYPDKAALHIMAEHRGPGSKFCVATTNPWSDSQQRDAHLIAAAFEQHSAGLEIHRLSLVIESAVRNADPVHHEAVLAAIKANSAAVAKAALGTDDGNLG